MVFIVSIRLFFTTNNYANTMNKNKPHLVEYALEVRLVLLNALLGRR